MHARLVTLRACVLIVCLSRPLAADSFGEELEKLVRLDFRDAVWEDVLRVFADLLGTGTEVELEVMGRVPGCRVNMQTAAMPLDQILSEMNRRYGLLFIVRDGQVRIHLPVDRTRLCQNDWVDASADP